MPGKKSSTVRLIWDHIRIWNKKELTDKDIKLLDNFSNAYKRAYGTVLGKIVEGDGGNHRADSPGNFSASEPKNSNAVASKMLSDFTIDHTYLNADKEKRRHIPPTGLSEDFFDKDWEREYSGKRIQEQIFEILDDIEEYNEARIAKIYPTYDKDPVSLVCYTLCHLCSKICDQLESKKINSLTQAFGRIELIREFILELRDIPVPFDEEGVGSARVLLRKIEIRLDKASKLLIAYRTQLCAKDYLDELYEYSAATVQNLFKWIACIPSDEMPIPRSFSLEKCINAITPENAVLCDEEVQSYLDSTIYGRVLRELVSTVECREFAVPYLQVESLPRTEHYQSIEEKSRYTRLLKDCLAAKQQGSVSGNTIIEWLRLNFILDAKSQAGIHADFAKDQHIVYFIEPLFSAHKLMVATITVREIAKFASQTGNLGVYVLRKEEINKFLIKHKEVVRELRGSIEKAIKAMDSLYDDSIVKKKNQPAWYDEYTALERKSKNVYAAFDRVLAPINKLLEEINKLSIEQRLQEANAQVQYLDRLFIALGITQVQV